MFANRRRDQREITIRKNIDVRQQMGSVKILCTYRPSQTGSKSQRTRHRAIAMTAPITVSEQILQQLPIYPFRYHSFKIAEAYRPLTLFKSLLCKCKIPRNISLTYTFKQVLTVFIFCVVLRVNCQDAVIYERPPPVTGIADRSTKTHLARTAYTKWKISSYVFCHD